MNQIQSKCTFVQYILHQDATLPQAEAQKAKRVKFLRLLAHHEKTIECSFLQKFSKKESPPGMSFK